MESRIWINKDVV